VIKVALPLRSIRWLITMTMTKDYFSKASRFVLSPKFGLASRIAIYLRCIQIPIVMDAPSGWLCNFSNM
jgi:hypothetical protein